MPSMRRARDANTFNRELMALRARETVGFDTRRRARKARGRAGNARSRSRDALADARRRGASRASRAPLEDSNRHSTRRDMRDDALAAYERRLDDVERRFEALRTKMELTLPSGLTKNARSGIRAAFASARLRAEKARAVASRDAPRRRRLGSKEGQRVLRSWILEHFDHPFPTREEKRRLAREIGLSEFSIGNFFINARARFHKPLVMALADELEREGVDVFNARDQHRV